jgi:hypothetical protein
MERVMMSIKNTHPLYYDCKHNPTLERYGLLDSNENFFYIIDNNLEVLKLVQLIMRRYENLNIVNIDHYFSFLSKTQSIIDKYQIDALKNNHNKHVANASIIQNNNDRIKNIQLEINNDNCFLFGVTPMSAQALPIDSNHFRLLDNIIRFKNKPNTFNDDVQEKIFLIRRIVYVLNALLEYLTEFSKLQEQITTDGLKIYKEYFKACQPQDTKFLKILEQDLTIEELRPTTINLYIRTVYKFLNELDLNHHRSVKDIILELCSKIKFISKQTHLDNPTAIMSYESYRITKILDEDLNSILKNL